MFKRAMLLSGLVFLSGAAQALAADETQSFLSLASKGYEVKSVTLVPMEAAQRANSAVNYDTVFVTLQKGTAVAVCYYAMTNWIYLDKTSLESSTQCEVR